ncbi:hypothetical protein GOBAR_DD15488 [Gossypium barbadense]|nr:hypothetical protein GOBAR_DD15488 [Gossypium barbadense]
MNQNSNSIRNDNISLEKVFLSGSVGMKIIVENGTLDQDKGHGSSGKIDLSKSGKVFNRTLKCRDDKFKAYGNSRIPLSESTNSMVELINSQMDTVDDIEVSTRNETGLQSSFLFNL